MIFQVFIILSIAIMATLGTNVCKYGDSTYFAEAFRVLNTDNSFCPLDSWLFSLPLALANSKPSSKYVFLNVGFNKGFNFGLWSSVFAPELGIELIDWYSAVNETAGGVTDCGCRGCDKVVNGSTRAVGTVSAGLLSFTSQPGYKYGQSALSTLKHPSTSHLKMMKKRSVRGNHNSLLRLRGNSIADEVDIQTPHLYFIGVDINRQNIKLVRDVANRLSDHHKDGMFNNSWQSHTTFDLHQFAISDQPGAIWVPKWSCGGIDEIKYTETCQPVRAKWIPKRNPKPTQFLQRNFQVNSLTLDAYVNWLENQHRPPGNDTEVSEKSLYSTIDILLIDTEGYDAKVIMGADSLLKLHRIRLLIFEYHSTCPWPEFKLQSVVELLYKYNYECFFDGDNGLWPVSDACWHSYYEFWEYSNVVCVLISDSWHSTLTQFVVKKKFVRDLRVRGNEALFQEKLFNVTLGVAYKLEVVHNRSVTNWSC